ncbi:hypothetical protein INT48_006305 [Thamnidium elegans]|uniref:Uncharacterized protein n=1 Tax=Thamnidium elegans TaxID=101142 RepID=A0A8H7VY06_9FUNG|nr:hypothetical protein INT48_006305 [Thamnidium elegans]
MNSTNKPKINILLIGLSGVGKTSLCQAFGANPVEGFSYGFGLSKKAQIVEFTTDKCTYHIIDAPQLYNPQDEAMTRKHADEMSRILNLASVPLVICFVICIQQHDMLVKSSDFVMMKTIAGYYNQAQVKFSLIINRLTQTEFSVISNNSMYRDQFLKSFERNSGVPITDDDILLIHNMFLTHSPREQKELLTSYLRKFEAGQMSEFGNLSDDPFITAYNESMQKYQSELKIIMEQNNMGHHNIFQQMMGGNSVFSSAPSYQPQQNPFSQFASAPQSPTSPYPANNYLGQYLQQAAVNGNAMSNAYLNQYLNSSNNNTYQQQAAFGATNIYNQQAPANPNNTNNQLFGAAGAFMGGAMDVPSMSGSNNDIYGAAGSFVGGAVTAGCTIM